ncbi:MAG: hypothetical protein ACYSUJ_10445 [Planctomycetota bacterium]
MIGISYTICIDDGKFGPGGGVKFYGFAKKIDGLVVGAGGNLDLVVVVGVIYGVLNAAEISRAVIINCNCVC